MPLIINGERLYRIGEALAAAPLSRATYFRWLKQGRVSDTKYRDRNGRRLFTEAELENLKQEAQRLMEAPQVAFKFEE
jgi:DNA-binding transcriptional MerR regulator